MLGIELLVVYESVSCEPGDVVSAVCVSAWIWSYMAFWLILVIWVVG